MTADRITIERELELIDGMIEVQLHHARQCDGIANRAMAEKQKGWDLERVALLRKLRAALAAQPADAQQEPVAEVHAAHLRPYDGSGGHWCREVLLYSGNNPHDWLDGKNTRVKLYATPPPAAVPLLTDAQVDAISMGLFGCINAAYRKQITDAVLSSGGGGITCATKRTVAQVRTATSAAPAAVPLTDEQILEIAEPFGCFQYGDAQGHKRIEFARAVLAAGDKP